MLIPKSEKYFAFNPYTYGGNNPIKFIDPNGKEIIILYKDKQNNTSLFLKYTDEGKLINTQSGKEFIDDKNGFIKDVKTALDNLKKLDNRTKSVVNELIKAKGKHYIRNFDETDGTKDETIGSFNKKGNKDTNPNGSNTKFDPDGSRNKKPENANWSNEEILGHELKHAYNRHLGIQDYKNYTDTGVEYEEVDAVNFQNVIRYTQNHKVLTKYRNNDIFRHIVFPFNYELPYTTNPK